MPKDIKFEQLKSSDLVNELNALLDALHIPIPLESPTDLTPSLLIAILSRLIAEKIPLEFSPHGRANRNIQSMKFFLGALESDVIKQDVGLSRVDPRRLANGEWDEVVFIGELLRWVGRQRELIGDAGDHEIGHKETARNSEVLSPLISNTSTTTKKTSTASNFSLHYHSESNTSVDFNVESLDIPGPTYQKWKGKHERSHERIHPRCIHEVPSPSVILSPELDTLFFEQSYCDCSVSSPSKRIPPPVRYTGYIEPVDEELELRTFERSQVIHGDGTQKSFDDLQSFDYLQLREARAYTVALLNERARLLEELAKLDQLP